MICVELILKVNLLPTGDLDQGREPAVSPEP